MYDENSMRIIYNFQNNSIILGVYASVWMKTDVENHESIFDDF